MKIFIFEHSGTSVPGGNRTSSSSGFRGDIMLRSLLTDMSRIETLDILTMPSSASHAPQLSNHRIQQSLDHEDIAQTIEGCIKQADAVWPLAPESNGLLEAISEKATQHNKILLGSTGAAIHSSASKYHNALTLHACGIPVVPTYRAQALLPVGPHGWVVKPDDGAGCSDTHIFPHSAAATDWIAAHPHGDYVLQPYIAGRPCNLSLLCHDNDVLLMACNDQRVAVSDNQFHYMGSIINSLDDTTGELKQLARRVLTAIPGLWGYVGIDFIVTKQGPVVLEVNPRMTVSHVGLHASLGLNPVRVMLEAMNGNGHSIPDANRSRQISVDIGARQSNRHVAE